MVRLSSPSAIPTINVPVVLSSLENSVGKILLIALISFSRFSVGKRGASMVAYTSSEELSEQVKDITDHFIELFFGLFNVALV